MRVAFIYSGALRSWNQCRQNHEANIWHEGHLFFHTYEVPVVPNIENLTHSFIQIPGRFYPDMFEHRFNTRKRPEAVVGQALNQWHNMFIGFCNVPLGYDVYVRIRPDLMFSGKINFDQYNYENKIYIPEGNDFWGVNDRFAFGSYEVMKKYYSVYVNHADLWDEGVTFHTETMQLANLKKQGVEIVRIPITEMILR